MSNGGTWEPPQAGATPPSPPPADQPAGGFTPPTSSPTVTVEPMPPRRSRGPVIAAIVGALALVGAGVFAVSRVVGDNAAGGADTPEEAGLAMLAALEDEDVLGIVDVLLPGERETMRGPVSDLVSELRRLEVLSDDADLSSIAGIDIVTEGESVVVADTNVDDIVNLTITATRTASVDGQALPIGDLVLENLDADPSELTTEAQEPEELSIPITAVREDDRWYLSAFYSVAETLRSQMVDAPDIPAEGVAPVGGDSPEDAMDNLVEGLEALDLEAIIAALNPDEFQALQRYAPMFLADAQSSLDQANVTLQVDDPEYTVTGDGDTRSLTISYLELTLDVEGDPGTITLEDGCWTVEASGETLDSCALADDMPQLEDMFEDPQPVEDLLTSLEATFTDYENPGFVVKRVDGGWYFSPMATVTDQMLAVTRALSREEIEDLQTTVSDALDVLSEDVFLFDDQLLPTEEDFAGPDEESVPTAPADDTGVVEDPTSDCYVEADGLAAAACFQALVDAGEIDAVEVPILLRFPECGLAEISWSGDYYSLPDEEFISIVGETAPCFQEKVAAGEIDELELPVELSNPECLEGRNPYNASDDDAYFEAVTECAYG